MMLLKIPRERVAVLIGKNGRVKKAIEKYTHTKIHINGEEIRIERSDDRYPLGELIARNIILAIGRGFSPEKAMELLDEECIIQIIDLRDYARNRNDLIRIKGRVIGREGKAKKKIEEMTETYISVYGKTVAIIGKPENVKIAYDAIKMLIAGAMHSTVYRYLERVKR